MASNFELYKKECKWVIFYEHSNKRGAKTKIVGIYNRENTDLLLGIIKWYGPFRRYSFFPEGNMVFEKQCMTDILGVMDELEEMRKSLSVAGKKLSEKKGEDAEWKEMKESTSGMHNTGYAW